VDQLNSHLTSGIRLKNWQLRIKSGWKLGVKKHQKQLYIHTAQVIISG